MQVLLSTVVIICSAMTSGCFGAILGFNENLFAKNLIGHAVFFVTSDNPAKHLQNRDKDSIEGILFIISVLYLP